MLIFNLDPNKGDYVPVVWSLRVEMICSIFFPLTLFMVTKRQWPLALMVGLAPSWAAHIDDLFTYVFMFIVGIILAVNRDRLGQQIRQLGSGVKFLILLLGILTFTSTWRIPISPSFRD